MILTVLALMLATPATAFSQQLPTCAESQPIPAGWSVIPASGPPGTVVTIIGDHGYDDVNFYVYYRPTGEVLVSETHAWLPETTGYSITVPEAFPYGFYDFVIVDNETDDQFCFSFDLTAPVQADAYPVAAQSLPVALPSTGFFVLAPIAGFIGLAVGGYMIRRRNS